MKTTKVGVISLGCAKNLVDSEVMLGHLGRAGCRFVQDPAEADVILVNTCGFIEAAREESVETILEAAELKKTGRLRRLVVAGCMVQRYAEELKKTLPEVDAFIGLDQLDRIVESAGVEAGDAVPASDLPLLQPGARAAGPTATAAWGPSTYLYDEHTPRSLATPAWTAYVKIAEGCDHTCAFCAIPSFRGSFRSRDTASIHAEALALSERGVREISLIAQDSSHYGRDLGMTEGLAALLAELNGIDALRWIRLHYLYPNTITPMLIETMAALPRVVDYVDLPLQHAHPDTLKRMRRGGSGESHLKLLERFRAVMPDGALRSTFIVGFPGETDDEFEALLDFVAAARFDHLGVFTYSHEESTPACAVPDDVPPEVKERRRERLMELQRGIATEANERRVGRTVEVLVEGAHPETEHLLVGRTRGQALDVDGQVLINDGTAEPGSFVRVELTETAGYDLVGRVVGA
ncbi:MAG: 30S ribosomal protein S12 methylthiotransferase RimO [Acidobacteria bacterium]|nr:30S ribosomal protein S12 methylthiotransferase RimO [Acidobacteriota bacterium]NIM62198.1 30S ribosomal protein S12 methylthiotransferase RimO [Acidobacteriota bacterium]NIO59817.1 30S ribosomal protein S12 methylthiotransferase RimO [Acidobacteriota bacterium]NIQ30900.1 30S ribosomal protein S12 methylthiotransferase RimO [Acidobacteriota bacterium]NIQ85976.1 30S ribosomal protein S12 methylthiotransferase RimO [Acidobacteriota bacterium]